MCSCGGKAWELRIYEHRGSLLYVLSLSEAYVLAKGAVDSCMDIMGPCGPSCRFWIYGFVQLHSGCITLFCLYNKKNFIEE